MYQSFIGLEIHIQLLTKAKVFCGCRAAFGDEPNTNVCPVCLGYPGVLPALNENAMKMAYLVALALNCNPSEKTIFERKNYYYPDLPKNYQISQFASPIGRDGYINIDFHGTQKRIRIHECHLEEDAGKMIHAGDMSLLDFNRAGTPLLEIVTEPDMEIGEEAEVLLHQLRRMVRYLGVCDGNMEEGSLRCDANVSVNLKGRGLGSKVEIKNMNSSRFVRRALNYEIDRQQDIMERGGTIVQETRLWNENRDVTETMRVKESANDYRYFPEPDLPPFSASADFLKKVQSQMVELPALRRKRLKEQYGLSDLQADFIIDEKETADFFESAADLGADPRTAATWMAADVQKLLNRHESGLIDSPLSPKRLADLLILLADGRIHGKIAKQTLESIFTEDKDPSVIIAEKGWEQINDPEELSQLVENTFLEYPDIADSVRGGDTKPVKFLMGRIMKATSGRANPQLVQKIIKEKLTVRIIHILGFGGAISGVRDESGMIDSGELIDVSALFDADDPLMKNVRFDEIQLGKFLSEEITPQDWAALITSVQERISGGNAEGIIIAHGTDTLSYTASLIYWLFSDTPVPIILTAAALPPGAESDAKSNLRQAVEKALGGTPGIYVCYGGKDYSPLNLRFEKVGSAEENGGTAPGFRNWDLAAPRPAGIPLSGVEELDRRTLTRRLENAIRSVFIAKVFPGMQGSSLISLMNSGIRFFILELFDTGTANLRETPFSLKKAFEYGQENNVRFFCTSQQESVVDFSRYVTSHELWKEGAIPTGQLTTESAYTRLIAALLFSENPEEVEKLMEEGQH